MKELAQVFTRLDEIKHSVPSYATLLHCVVRTSNESNRLPAGIFTVLRQKKALMMQKHISGNLSRLKLTLDSDADCSHYDFCTVGVSRTGVDCLLQNFESISRVLREKLLRAMLTPAYEFTQFPAPDIGPVEILLNSIGEICSVLSIYGTDDLLSVSKGEKVCFQERY